MKIPPPIRPLATKLAVLCAALAAFVHSGQAQVTLSQVTNGLVSFYPLDFVATNGATFTTPDYLGGRDMILVGMNGANVTASTRPSGNSASVSNCFNFNQAGGTTIMYYDTQPQDPVTGGGDFLPFFNQINATMSFWIKCNVTVTPTTGFRDKRFFGECDDGSGAGTGPICLFGTDSAGADPGGGLNNNLQAHFLLRQKNGSGGLGETDTLIDGTKEIPNINNWWVQGNNFTSNNVLDGSWHLFTMTVDSNRVYDFYVDGVRDLGPTNAATDIYGNLTYGPAVPLTNVYYTTNIYPSAGVSNPPPNGYVRWMWNGLFKKGVTAFGGFRRTGGNTGGFPMNLDDIAFWNRTLSSQEIEFLRTNGLTGISINRPLQINSWSADFAEIGKGDTVTLRWNVTGANSTSGGIVISGVGDVSAIGPIGSTNVTLSGGDQTFTLTVFNGLTTKSASLSVKTFAGVDSGWHLIERFDGLYSDTINDAVGGLTANNWLAAGSDFSGNFDKWNVFTLTNNGALNKVLTPRTGYNPNASSLTGFESRGALASAKLGSLSLSPGKTNTLFFRFSLQEPGTNAAGLYSDMDFGVGLSDYNFLGPSAGLGYYGGTGGGLGPYFSILRNSGDPAQFNGPPFDLFAPDLDEGTATTTNTYHFTTSNPAGLETNQNYLVWMDVENYSTHAAGGGGSNTVNEAQYSVWLQKQGDPTRTRLFTNFHGNRNYVAYNPVNDAPTPTLDKVFFNLGSESFVAAAAGSYITTNMIAVDDIYLSKSGVASTIPRLFDITSIVKGPSSVTIQWDSLGSLFGTNTYTVQRKFQLTDPTWTTLTTMPSGGATTTYVDNTIGSNASAYYRIVWP